MAFLSSFKMLDAETIAAASSAIQLLVTIICYVAITSAAIKFPIINRILSLFLSANGPTYQEPPQAMSNKNTWGILIFGIVLAASSHTSAQCCDGPESQCQPVRETVLGFAQDFKGFAAEGRSVLANTRGRAAAVARSGVIEHAALPGRWSHEGIGTGTTRRQAKQAACKPSFTPNATRVRVVRRDGHFTAVIHSR